MLELASFSKVDIALLKDRDCREGDLSIPPCREMRLELDAEERVYLEFILATLYRECISIGVTMNLTFFHSEYCDLCPLRSQ